MVIFNRAGSTGILFYFVIRIWPAQSFGKYLADSAHARTHARPPACACTCTRPHTHTPTPARTHACTRPCTRPPAPAPAHLPACAPARLRTPAPWHTRAIAMGQATRLLSTTLEGYKKKFSGRVTYLASAP